MESNEVFKDEKDSIKRDVYREKATILFEHKMARNSKASKGAQDPEFSEQQCEYFFTYCSYICQINGLDKKCEKMRVLKAMSSLWMTGFATLFLTYAIKAMLILLHIVAGTPREALEIFIISLGFMVLSVISYFRMKENTIKWIRMVLAVYDAYTDQAKHS